jgi:hypothetical protein
MTCQGYLRVKFGIPVYSWARYLSIPRCLADRIARGKKDIRHSTTQQVLPLESNTGTKSTTLNEIAFSTIINFSSTCIGTKPTSFGPDHIQLLCRVVRHAEFIGALSLNLPSAPTKSLSDPNARSFPSTQSITEMSSCI